MDIKYVFFMFVAKSTLSEDATLAQAREKDRSAAQDYSLVPELSYKKVPAQREALFPH